MKNAGGNLIVFVVLWAASGCVHMHPTTSGFLSDYSDLVPADKKDRVRTKSIQPHALADIDSFYIEPVEWLADDLGQPASDPQRAATIRDSLENSLAKELAKIRPIVQEVGPGTARVRAAITGVQESKPFANLFLAVQIAGPLFNGGAVAEIEIISPQGRQIAAESAAFTGSEWDVVGYFWGPKHPSAAVARAAKQISSDLDVAQAAEPTIAQARRDSNLKPAGFRAGRPAIGALDSTPSATNSLRSRP
jgi:Protein of unknown function (DUF3313)